MVEAGGISEGGQATAAEDMDGAMAYCGSGGTGAGQRMAEADGKGLLMLTHITETEQNEVMCKLFCLCFHVIS
jgi:hypothetical protein